MRGNREENSGWIAVGKLFLIPNLLGQSAKAEVIPYGVGNRINELTRFIVENGKTCQEAPTTYIEFNRSIDDVKGDFPLPHTATLRNTQLFWSRTVKKFDHGSSYLRWVCRGLQIPEPRSLTWLTQKGLRSFLCLAPLQF